MVLLLFSSHESVKKALVSLMFFSHAKNESRSGRTVKKVQNHKKALVLYCVMCFWLRGTVIPGRLTVMAASRFVCVSVCLLFDAP